MKSFTLDELGELRAQRDELLAACKALLPLALDHLDCLREMDAAREVDEAPALAIEQGERHVLKAHAAIARAEKG